MLVLALVLGVLLYVIQELEDAGYY